MLKSFGYNKLSLYNEPFLPPANEVCEGYVFTGVCLSTGGAKRGRGHAWRGACVAGGRAW